MRTAITRSKKAIVHFFTSNYFIEIVYYYLLFPSLEFTEKNSGKRKSIKSGAVLGSVAIPNGKVNIPPKSWDIHQTKKRKPIVIQPKTFVGFSKRRMPRIIRLPIATRFIEEVDTSNFESSFAGEAINEIFSCSDICHNIDCIFFVQNIGVS